MALFKTYTPLSTPWVALQYTVSVTISILVSINDILLQL